MAKGFRLPSSSQSLLTNDLILYNASFVILHILLVIRLTSAAPAAPRSEYSSYETHQ
jgi:hypothetical protein